MLQVRKSHLFKISAIFFQGCFTSETCHFKLGDDPIGGHQLWCGVGGSKKIIGGGAPLIPPTSTPHYRKPCSQRLANPFQDSILKLKPDSHLPKKFVLYFHENAVKMMKNAFYFVFKAIIVLKIFFFFFCIYVLKATRQLNFII